MIGSSDFKKLWRSEEQDEFKDASPKVAKLGRSINKINKYNGSAKLDHSEIIGYKKQFAAAFGETRMREAFGAIQAKITNERSVKYRDIKSAFDQAFIYQAPGQATKQRLLSLEPRIEEAQKRVKLLERQRGEIAVSSGYPEVREAKLKHKDKALTRARTELGLLQNERQSLQAVDRALDHPPKPGEDEEELATAIDVLGKQVTRATQDLEQAQRALHLLQLRDQLRMELGNVRPEAGAMGNSQGLVNRDGEEEEEDDSWTLVGGRPATSKGADEESGSITRRTLDDGHEEEEATTVADAQRRVADAHADLKEAKGALLDAKQRLQALRATPEALRARVDMAALGQDPRLYQILKEAVPEKVSDSANQERKANWRPSSSVPWAAEKAIGIIAGPALLPLNAWRTLSAEKLQRHMVGAAKGLDNHPFARGVAAAVGRSAALDAARSGFGFAIGAAFAAPSLLPSGGTLGAIAGTAASNAMRHGGTLTHQVVNSAVSDTFDAAAGEGIDRTIGRQFEHAAEDDGGQLMPMLPIVTPRGATVYVDLNDTDVLKACLAYLWPPEDVEASRSSDKAKSVAEGRRVEFRERYFGAKPWEHYAHKGKSDEAEFNKQVKAIHAELTSGRPGKAMAAASPLLVLYVALQWTG